MQNKIESWTFSTEKLNAPPCVNTLIRSYCSSGWYVRAVFCHEGFGAGAFCESALFLDDPDRSWDANEVTREKLASEPRGGIFRCNVPKGWIILATASGQTRMRDYHEKFDTRFGSITFIPKSRQTATTEITKSEKDNL